jgi:diacylglycerol kinase (ATP)
MNNIFCGHWGIVVNSHAGKRVLGKNYVKIDDFFNKNGINFTKILTKYRGHAIEIAKNLVEKGIRNLFIVGGDGTLNEVVNGIYNSNIVDKEQVIISVIPYGSGNDWARYWKLSNKIGDLQQLFVNGKIVTIDIGKFSCKISENQTYRRFFLNGAGFGFDGQVVKTTNKLKKYWGSSFAYTISMLASVFITPSQSMILRGRKVLEDKIFSVAIGNGCFSGGGMRQVPKANPTDGLLHVTAIRRPKFLEIISGLIYLFNGKIDEHSITYSFETEHFISTTAKPVAIETDGVEMPASTELSFKIVPKALKMLVPL